MNIITVYETYRHEKLLNPMEIDVETASWVNNKMNPYSKGSKYPSGYFYWLVTLENGKKKHLRVHRQVWFAVNGDIPSDLQVDHIDSDKSHNYISNLQLLTPKENCNKEDKLLKQSFSLRGKGTSLTEDDVKDIYVLANRKLLSQSKIGKLFNIAQQTVNNIKVGNSWKWLTEDLDVDNYKIRIDILNMKE